MEAAPPAPVSKQERLPESIAEGLWLFPPNRDTQGGSAWLLQTPACTVLVDLPALSAPHLHWLQQRVPGPGGAAGAEPPAWIVLTGRHGHGRCRAWQEALGWPVLVQEQEAYLLPSVRLHTFSQEHQLAAGLDLLWTPGPSPGACVLHSRGGPSGDGLFCGRLLLPAGPGRLAPLRRRSTFHWPRQLQSLDRLCRWLPPGSPGWIASGGALGGLRGEKLVRTGVFQLSNLNLEDLAAQLPEGG